MIKMVKSGENIVLSRADIAVILGVITIFSVFASIIAYSVSAKNDINSLRIDVDELKLTEEEHPLLRNDLAIASQKIAVLEAKLDAIKEDTTYIKELLKNG